MNSTTIAILWSGDYFKKFKSATYQFTRSKWNVLDLYRKLKDKMLWEEILYKGSINNALN